MITNLIILGLAAIVPPILLMKRVYKKDRLEQEDGRFLQKLITAGMISCIPAYFMERGLGYVLDSFVSPESTIYPVIEYFFIVAVSEEMVKYIALSRKSWHYDDFDCLYDGIIYAVFVSLGFALVENVLFVLFGGLSTALLRAFTAIPGHACFAVFMGVFYSLAKKNDNMRNDFIKSVCLVLAYIIPVVLHGFYDYIVSIGENTALIIFVIFIITSFIITNIIINSVSKNDKYI